MRERINIDKRWRFHLGDEPDASDRSFDHSSWRLLDVPHDWSIEATPHPDNAAGAEGGFYPGGIGWYRKELPIPPDLGDREVLIEFDGVYRNSEVYCNSTSCGRRPYGYSSFCYNLSALVTAGETSVISVRVDNSEQPNSRWYTGSGIYRHVWLTIVSPVRIDHWGTSLSFLEISETEARLESTTTIVNNRNAKCGVELSTTLVSPSGVSVGTVSNRVDIAGGERREVPGRMIVDHPELWSPDTPLLYTLQSRVTSGGVLLDSYETRCGIRSIRFDADEGFFLNEMNIKFKGVNEHHDAGSLGAAVPDDVIRRRFAILREMGCNAIRTAHNPASPSFLDLCDEIGFMVVEDAFDEWREGKTKYGYHLNWDQWSERDLSDMIRRDRNHPSIVMWSIGNEIIEVREGKPEGVPVMTDLREICHRNDPTRPVTCGCCSIRETNAAGYGALMDVVGYNGGGGSCFDYEIDHRTYPERIIFASEVPHTLQTRGVYRTQSWYRDLSENPELERIEVSDLSRSEVFTGFDEQYQSSYDNAMVRISSIDSWRLTDTLPFLCGEFRWSGFDYLGESNAWPAKSWNYGIIDLCGFPKDSYFFYQSQWSTVPMVHLLPHWTWPGLEGSTIPVVAYSNCKTVELFVNDTSHGIKDLGSDMFLCWNVDYEPGILRAIAYHGDRAVAHSMHATAENESALRLTCDDETVRADGTGIAHVTIEVVDDRGIVHPHAAPELAVSVAGAGTLIGIENGDPIDTTNYQCGRRRAFNGMALAIVQASKAGGGIRVFVEAEGLSSSSIEIQAI